MKRDVEVEFDRKIMTGEKTRIEVRIADSIGDIKELKILYGFEGSNPSIVKQMKKIKEDKYSKYYCTHIGGGDIK